MSVPWLLIVASESDMQTQGEQPLLVPPHRGYNPLLIQLKLFPGDLKSSAFSLLIFIFLFFVLWESITKTKTFKKQEAHPEISRKSPCLYTTLVHNADSERPGNNFNFYLSLIFHTEVAYNNQKYKK